MFNKTQVKDSGQRILMAENMKRTCNCLGCANRTKCEVWPNYPIAITAVQGGETKDIYLTPLEAHELVQKLLDSLYYEVKAK